LLNFNNYILNVIQSIIGATEILGSWIFSSVFTFDIQQQTLQRRETKLRRYSHRSGSTG